MQTREKTKQTRINKEEKDKMRNKKGISLIVLVITIIVMIILAAAVIISLSNSGVINRANQAVNATNLAEVQHLASLAWSEAYLENMNLPEEERDAKIKEAVEAAFTENDLNVADYNLTYGAGGVTVTSKAETVTSKWEVVRTTDANGVVTKVVVTDGTNEIEVGSTVNYMPDGVNGYTGGWKVLGADEEGQLLIMSADDIASNVTLGGTTYATAKTSYENALTTLQDTVKDYVDGTIGVAIRSITAEDVNKVTGYDPVTYTDECFMNDNCAEANLKAYNVEVTYTWNSTGVGYSWKNGSETKTGNLSDTHDNGFTYYNEETGKFVTVAKATTGEITSLNTQFYYYLGDTSIATTTKAYKMLFRNVADTANATYWLASRDRFAYTDCADFGMRYVSDDGAVNGHSLVCSADERYSQETSAVRAVVTLAADVTLTETATGSGVYNVAK